MGGWGGWGGGVVLSPLQLRGGFSSTVARPSVAAPTPHAHFPQLQVGVHFCYAAASRVGFLPVALRLGCSAEWGHIPTLSATGTTPGTTPGWRSREVEQVKSTAVGTGHQFAVPPPLRLRLATPCPPRPPRTHPHSSTQAHTPHKQTNFDCKTGWGTLPCCKGCILLC